MDFAFIGSPYFRSGLFDTGLPSLPFDLPFWQPTSSLGFFSMFPPLTLCPYLRFRFFRMLLAFMSSRLFCSPLLGARRAFSIRIAY